MLSTMTNLKFILFLCCIFGVQNSLCKLQLNKSVKATFIRHFNSKSNSNSCGTIGSYCLNDLSCCSYSCDLSICCSISDCTNDTDCCNGDSNFCINGFCQVRNL
uniref:Uncharacterized protein n=1 Tax=Acrobeloides nanus TaxID=290746 RepID=A0A914E3L8_9BILA